MILADRFINDKYACLLMYNTSWQIYNNKITRSDQLDHLRMKQNRYFISAYRHSGNFSFC
jgi:CTP:phosphocholine cytidylyltransferase-like protein